MTLHDKEILRDDLYHAIKKIYDKHYELGTFVPTMMTGSHVEFTVNQIMQMNEVMVEYYKELKSDGYINE